MKNKFNLGKLIFIIVGIFLWALPIEAKASDYDFGFKFYKISSDDAAAFETFLTYYSINMRNVEEITDMTTIKKDDYFIVAPQIKYNSGGAQASAFSLYFSYDNSIIQSGGANGTAFAKYMGVPKKMVGDSYMPTAWILNSGSDIDGNIALNFGDNAGSVLNKETTGDAIFVVFKALENITEENIPNFKYYTEDRKLTSTIDGVTGVFVSMGSTPDNQPVSVNTTDYAPPKKASSNNALASISAVNGSDKYIDLNWDNGSTETAFNGVVPANIDNLTLSIKPYHSLASIMCTKGCTGSASAGASMNTSLTGLKTGSNSIEVTVTAEDASIEVYTIDIKRLNDNASLESVTLTNGITLNYDSATKTYSATNVPYSTNKTNISASVVANSNAVIDSTGTTWTVTSGAINNVSWNLTNTGGTPNTGTIKVNAENCNTSYDSVPGNTCTTSTYNVRVSRNAPKTIATLKSLTVDDTLVTGFVPNDATHLEYTLADTTRASFNIAGVVTDNSNATITSGTGSVSLAIGDNTFNIVVTAEDGTTTNTYKIKVKRLSTDATLSGLSITSNPQGTMSPSTFSSGTKTYKYIYDETVSNVTITATANHSGAMVQIGSDAATKGNATNSNINPTTNSVNIIVTAEDGHSTDTYTINFERKKSTINTLRNLSVKDSNGKEYITGFSSTTNTINITVENDITSLDVKATATSSGAKVGSRSNPDNTYIATINNLGFSSNVHTITVYPEDTSATNGTYTINVTRKQSSNANLTDLKVDNISLANFDGTQSGTYNLSDVDSTKASVLISYIKENNEADVKITNNGTNVTGNTVNLSEGNNVIVVTVKSQDSSKTIGHTINIKKKSSVATLSGLSITSSPQGTMNPNTFSSGTKTYKYIYDETVGNVTINATATNSDADVKIGSEAATKGSATSNGIDPKTTTSVDIVVTAEDGHSTDTYTINFERKKSTVNTLSSLSVKDSGNNEYITNFSASTKTYNITVPHDVTSLNIRATATSDAAKINNGSNTYTGSIDNLNFTSNSLVLTVSPEQGSNETYTINVTRTKSNNAYLTDLRVDGNTVNGFNKLDDSTPFDIGSVANNVTSLNITYDKENQYSVDVVSDNNLSVGNNTVIVKITSQDGTKTMEYKIKVHRMSTDVSLANLDVTSVPQGTLKNNGDGTYTYTYDRSVTSVNITATATNGTTVMNTGTHNINNGSVTLTVNPEDVTAPVGTYRIDFVQALETDSSLNKLEVLKDNNPYTLNKVNDTTYNLVVDSDIDTVDIAATLNGSYVKKITIDGHETINPTGKVTQNVSLNPGNNAKIIEVVAEDNSKTTYTVNITRTINSSATLTDLQVDHAQVPDFSASKVKYDLDDVSYLKDEIEITALGVSGAKVTGDTGTQSLKVGVNSFTIHVESQDGKNNATYTINIRRKSNEAKITNLTSNNGTLHNGSTEFIYTIDIPSGVGSINLTPTFALGATLKTPNSLNNIDITNISEIRFTVQAEDNTYTNEYVINLNKLDAGLANLSVNKGTLSPSFAKNTLEYTVTVASNVEKINIIATKENTGDIVSGDGEKNLNFGEQTFTVAVTAMNGQTKDYKIKVTRELSSDKSLRDLTINGATITGFNSTKNSYNITLPYGTTSFELGAIPTDANARIPANELGRKTISGNQTFTFTVTAQDGTPKTYTINVTIAQNSDTSIASLTVLSKTPTWNSAKNRYELTVDGETLTISPNDVKATFTNGASITKKDAQKDLALGGNTYKFTVTASSGATREYSILITRKASTINTLESLTSSVGVFSPTFDKDTNKYKLTLPEGTKSFKINAKATSKNPATTIVGTGDYTMPVKNNLISVTVTSEDGRANVYEITVEETITKLDKISSSVHTIKDDYILTVRALTKFDDKFKGRFDNEPSELVLYLKDGVTKVTNQNIGTGMILKLERNGKVLDQKIIVVLGDTNGDGKISTNDAVVVVSHALGTLIDGPYLLAADTNNDGKVSTNDAVTIVSHALGNSLYKD